MKNNVMKLSFGFLLIVSIFNSGGRLNFFFTGDPMFRGDGPIPEDRAVREEGGLHPRLHLPAAQCDACEPRAGRRLRHDARPGMQFLNGIFSPGFWA